MLSKFATGLPNQLAGGTANLLGRIPRVGGVLKHAIDIPRKLVGATVEATNLQYHLENDVDKLEEKFTEHLELIKKISHTEGLVDI